ncbi:MAG: hypothetical protein AB7V27_01265 [Candidatus Binatia bacterium]
MQLTLTDAEADLLKDVLTSYLSELRMEIADTDAAEFREVLKEREELLKRVIDKLNHTASAVC